MKKMLAILLSAVMVLALLAGCGSKDNDKNKDSDTQGGDASALNVAVFYYDFSDVYISSVRNSMEEQFTHPAPAAQSAGGVQRVPEKECFQMAVSVPQEGGFASAPIGGAPAAAQAVGPRGL